ncbi:unnamed protein product [Phaedon cochleariae]|uniref:Uncharacterized protein n=1 Tax=Phaedon cochleariae TaxID=80249 RepID=A0A9N9S9V7_PHACE|nr:unnamed protein product [Phaedon cochleariae]
MGQQILINQPSPQNQAAPRQQLNQHLWSQQQTPQIPGQQQIIRHPVNVIQQGSPRVQWSPTGQQGAGPPPQRQFIQLDARTHQELQKMPPEQQAIFVAKIQRHRQFLKQGGQPAQQAPGLSPINQGVGGGGQFGEQGQQQQVQIRQFRLQHLQLQREQAQKSHLAQQQGAIQQPTIVRPIGQPPQPADSTANMAQAQVDGGVQHPLVVNAKTKTALANMLSIKLQSGGSSVGGGGQRAEAMAEPHKPLSQLSSHRKSHLHPNHRNEKLSQLQHESLSQLHTTSSSATLSTSQSRIQGATPSIESILPSTAVQPASSNPQLFEELDKELERFLRGSASQESVVWMRDIHKDVNKL